MNFSHALIINDKLLRVHSFPSISGYEQQLSTLVLNFTSIQPNLSHFDSEDFSSKKYAIKIEFPDQALFHEGSRDTAVQNILSPSFTFQEAQSKNITFAFQINPECHAKYKKFTLSIVEQVVKPKDKKKKTKEVTYREIGQQQSFMID